MNEGKEMANELSQPKTLQEAIVYFSDPERAFVYAVNLRWPRKKVTCPRCDCKKHSFLKTRLMWFCKGCKRQFSVKVGSIFEDSPLGLDKWMTAFWMVVNCKNGVSSAEMARTLSITQKSAWFMLHRIREVLANKSFGDTTKIGGSGQVVETDEAFIGGVAKNMHKDRKLKLQQIRGEERRGDIKMGKTAVLGMLDRESRTVRALVVPNVRRETLQNLILKNIKYGSKVYTDSAVAYDALQYRYIHDWVNHAERYVKGQVHTNGLENFWSLFKRNLRGTYVSVEPFHLDRYLDEQVFRFNNRGSKKDKVTDADRFYRAMSRVAGKRLTYAQLTGKGTDSLHHPTAEAGQEEAF
jgi:transposase-like protein